jgi:hypothetical protein
VGATAVVWEGASVSPVNQYPGRTLNEHLDVERTHTESRR